MTSISGDARSWPLGPQSISSTQESTSVLLGLIIPHDPFRCSFRFGRFQPSGAAAAGPFAAGFSRGCFHHHEHLEFGRQHQALSVCALRLSVPHEPHGLLSQAAVYAHLLGARADARFREVYETAQPRNRFHPERDTMRIIVFERVQ